MQMIPTAYDDIEITTDSKQASKTYKLCDDGHIRGFIDGTEALKQTIFCILSTQQYIHAIYSRSYGFDKAGIIGADLPLGYAEVQDKITSALMSDNRISSVGDFAFSSPDKKAVHVSFTVTSADGVKQSEEVIVNV